MEGNACGQFESPAAPSNLNICIQTGLLFAACSRTKGFPKVAIEIIFLIFYKYTTSWYR